MAKKTAWYLYDADTAMGNNNEGDVNFPYWLEDIDKTEGGADVFNGQDSVFWNLVREAFADRIGDMYRELRTSGKWSYAVVDKMFRDHQSKWPEALDNEDAQYKYEDPYINDGNASYFSMEFGTKELQRMQWSWHRFRLYDSKYNTGDALTEVITVRGYAKGDIAVTPYASIYASIKYGSYLVQQRAVERNVPVTLPNPLDNVNDTEIYIYSADQIADIGDISPLKIGYGDFSHGIKLVNIKIGDKSDSYINGNLKELYLGNNTLLQTVDVRNCPNLTQAVDLSGCTGLREAYFDGTSITAVSLPNGGVLNTLHLPDTVTTLIIRNQPYLSDFVLNDWSNISTLMLENVGDAIDGLDKVLNEDFEAGSRFYIAGFNKTYENDDDFSDVMKKLMTMRGIDVNGNTQEEAVLDGEVTVGEISRYIYDNLYRWPGLTVHYDTIGAYDYVLHLENSTKFTEYNDDKITTIRPYAFYGSNVTTVNTPNVTKIGAMAFQSSKIEEANFPLVTTMESSTYYGATNLKKINVDNLSIATNTTSFIRNTAVEALHFKHSLSLGNHQYFIAYNPNLKTLVFEKSITTPNNAAYRFSYNSNLTAVDIYGVLGGGNRISGGEYQDNTSLEVFVIRMPTLESINNTGVFARTPLVGNNGTYSGHVYVPEALIESYKTATNWSTMYANYPDIFRPIEGSEYEHYYVDGTPIEEEDE